MRVVDRYIELRTREDELDELARKGSLEKLKKAKPKASTFSFGTLKAAIKGGHVETFDYLVQDFFTKKKGFVWKPSILVELAIDSGNMDMLRKVLDTFVVKPHEMNVGSAGQRGRLDILEYLVSKGSKCVDTAPTLKAAAQACQMRVVKWLVARGVKFKNAQDLCASLSDNGEFEMLKYVIKHGGKADYQACERAAYQGYIHILVYLHEIGCEWNYSTCVAAASGGHLDCLKYARDNGCEWNGHVYHAALLCNHVYIMEYLRINGCPLPDLDVLEHAYEICYEECEPTYCDDDEEHLYDRIYCEDMSLARTFVKYRELEHAIAIKNVQNKESSTLGAIKSLMSMIDENSTRLPENEYLKMCNKAKTIFDDIMERPR